LMNFITELFQMPAIPMVLALGLLIFFLRGKKPTNDNKADFHFSLANKKSLSKLHDEAIELYTKAIHENTQFAKESYVNRAINYSKKGNYEEALLDCKKAIQLDKDFSEAYAVLGDIYSLQRLFQDAIKAYTEALKINSQDLDALIGRAYSLAQNSDYKAAEKDYSKAIDLSPDDSALYYSRAVVRYAIAKENKDDQYKQLAEQDFQRVNELKA
jgi:tetratricopeptide (TPR) repeat protein